MKRKRTKTKNIKDTYNRSRMMIVEFVIQTCSRMYLDGFLLPVCGANRGFICDYPKNVKIPIGSLCMLSAAPSSKYYLSWYLGEKDGEHYLQSIEDHSVVRASNVAISHLPLEMTEECPQFHYSDRQFSFQDRWHKVVKQKSYWLVPMYSVFNEDNNKVTLRLRQKYDDKVFEYTLPSWKMVSSEELNNVAEKLANQINNKQKED